MTKIGHTGLFFRPSTPPVLGEFVRCRVLDAKDETLIVETKDGTKGEIPTGEFTPMYFRTEIEDGS